MKKPYDTPNLLPVIKEKTMALLDVENNEELNDEFNDIDDYLKQEDKTAGISGWGISIVLHLLVLLILGTIMFHKMIQQEAPVRNAYIEPPPMVEEVKDETRDVTPQDITVVAEEVSESPVVTQLELPVEEFQTEDEIQNEQSEAKGREEAVSNVEMGSTGAFAAIGAGGATGGAFGSRTGGGIRVSIGRNGGSQRSEGSVNAALLWFKRHQSPNGQWDVDGYGQNCSMDGPKCEPGTAHTGRDGDVACTGYAILAFLGHGHDHMSNNPYRRTVRNGIEWLIAQQNANGLFGERNYEHAIATMAIAEAYAMTTDDNIREPLERAVAMILERQAQSGGYGLGWDYTSPNPNRNDSSVSGWNIMALKSARMGGVDVGNGMEGAEQYLNRAWSAANNGIDPNTLNLYEGTSQFPYTWNATTDAVSMHNGNLTSVGALCAVFLGKREGDPMLETMGNWIFQNQLPTQYPTDTYFMYYNTLTMFQLGGERWRVWNTQVRDMLVNSQRNDEGCFDGSWNPEGAGAHSISSVGRLLVTAYCTLSLEVYYRYDRVTGRNHE